MNIGKIVQVTGPVVDVNFPNEIPAINNALTIKYDKSMEYGVDINLVLEVAFISVQIRLDVLRWIQQMV